MREYFNRSIRSAKTMHVSVIIIILGCIYNIVRTLIVKHTLLPLNTALVIAVTLFTIVTYCTYRSHDKNIMKPAIGMLMGAVVMYSLYIFLENILDADSFADYFNAGAAGYVSLFLDFMQMALFFALCVMHLVINKSHDSSPKEVFANQIIVMALFAVYVLQIIFAIPVFRSVERIIYLTLFYLMLGFITTFIVCIESNIDNFRALREREKEQKTENS